MSRKNDSTPYSYYLDRFAVNLFNFRNKELALRHYVVYMLNRTQKIFEYDGLPDTIPKRMLEFLLQVNGFACICKVKDDLYAMRGGLGGEPDAYYQPTICVVANPALKFDKTLKIHEDCVIMRNDSFRYGLLPMFRRYATAMVENDISFRMASINTRIQALLTAPDDSTRAAAEKYLDDVESGKLGAIQVNEFLNGMQALPMTNSQRTFTDLIEYQQYIKASWFNEIGLNANYNMKREKLSTTESQMNSDALLPLVDDMLENRQTAIDEINAMFGTNITVRFASSWEKLLEEFQQESNQLDGGDMNDDTGDSEYSTGNGSGDERTDDRGENSVSSENVGETSLDSSGDNHDEENEDDVTKLDAGDGGDAGDNGNDERSSGAVEATTSSNDGDTTVNVTVNVDVKDGDDDAEGKTDGPDDSVRENSE